MISWRGNASHITGSLWGSASHWGIPFTKGRQCWGSVLSCYQLELNVARTVELYIWRPCDVVNTTWHHINCEQSLIEWYWVGVPVLGRNWRGHVWGSQPQAGVDVWKWLLYFSSDRGSLLFCICIIINAKYPHPIPISDNGSVDRKHWITVKSLI